MNILQPDYGLKLSLEDGICMEVKGNYAMAKCVKVINVTKTQSSRCLAAILMVGCSITSKELCRSDS